MHEVTLESLAGGAAIEKFNIELERVYSNIVDPNTPAKKTREVNLRVRFTPDESRKRTLVEIETTAKLAGDKAVGTICYIAQQGGQVIAVEDNPEQLTLETFVQRHQDQNTIAFEARKVGEKE